ncbi:thiol:disulfide interchange protein TlpA [Pinisolibacter aquiterrae]|uniref:thiol:disulfide interchange protein TlpA n=1 Tax=Pinisolibacter aquiterrae TaxID=2815579 RepID=UPI001C3E0D42|nr:TlpA disulfide reductase family protein [Pinisolibacter aquiterrae]MBV5262946.1 TlpA family protein disulfide reductase [Pinisolibacter aquiterrae]MCC8235287.1 TlpA family protein disulfide reductase [Pinisolibacter aquiterrae]
MSHEPPHPDRPTDAAPAPRATWRLGLVAIALGAAIGIAGIYGIGALGGNDDAGGKCAAAPAAAARLAPLATGDLAGLAFASTPRDLSGLTFAGADGAKTTLADWKGRVVLLNLWATWCPPCRAEMPSLDRLQAGLGSKDFEVVTVNLDTRDPERPKSFLAEIGVAALTHRTDATMGIFKALQKLGLARGLPTTILVDRSGCEVATLAGPAHWDGTAAKALLAAAVKP